MSGIRTFHDDSINRFSSVLAEMSSCCKTKAQLREIHRLNDTFLVFLDRLECADAELNGYSLPIIKAPSSTGINDSQAILSSVPSFGTYLFGHSSESDDESTTHTD